MKEKKNIHEYQNESDAEPKNDRKLYEKHERHYNMTYISFRWRIKNTLNIRVRIHSIRVTVE